jgi:pyridoxine 5-phosphate synthase
MLMSVAVDYVAYLRNLGQLKEPDPSHAAVLAELAGADGITCHLREDRLHIRDRDIYILKEVVRSVFTLRIAPREDLLERVLEVKPRMVTLVPFSSSADSAEDESDLTGNRELYVSAAAALNGAGIDVCFRADPLDDAVKEAARARAKAVEFSVQDYARAFSGGNVESELIRLEQMSQLAVKLGMTASCGGGLNYRNIRPVINLGVFRGFTVGYAIASRAMLVGFERATREMADIIRESQDRY